MELSNLRSVSMSRTWGMFSRITSSSVRMAAAMQGRAEFFAPETLMVPSSGFPPRTTNLSIPSSLRGFAVESRGVDGTTAQERGKVVAMRGRPEKSEATEYFWRYIDRVTFDDPVRALVQQLGEAME